MAWQIPQSTTAPGIIVDLGTTDDAFIASGVTIASTDFVTVFGTGSNHEVLIYGTVAAAIGGAIQVGNTSDDTNNVVTIKAGAHVQAVSGGGVAVAMVGSNAKIVNEGLLSAVSSAAAGIFMGGSTATQSEIVNSGTIEGVTAAVDINGSETYVLNNSGLLTGGVFSFRDIGNGIDLITNTGQMIGVVSLGNGDDMYNGAAGRLTGLLSAGIGDDTVIGGIDNDQFLGGLDNDTLRGNAGNDNLGGDEGNDLLDGGTGADTLNGGDGNDLFRISSTQGIGDTFIGGIGTDRIQVVGSGSASLSAFNAGASSIEWWQGNGKGLLGTSAANAFSLSGLSSLSGLAFVDGRAGNDTIIGSKFADVLLGGSGNDRIYGGLHVDEITGGAGRDIMTGGDGRDDFNFNSISETGKTSSTRDVITDFEHGLDDIDLSTIDANGSAAGNAAFTFLASKGAAFTGDAGELRWFQQNLSGTASDKTIIEGDVNGDARADFQIQLTGLKTLTASDFIL